MEWGAPEDDGLGFLSLWVFFPCETKHIENYSRMPPGDYRFIPNPENRSVHAAVRKVYYVVLVLEIRISIRKPVLQINIV